MFIILNTNSCRMYTEIRISGFRRALLGYYAAQSGNSLPTFRDKLSVTYSRAKKSKKKNNIGCPETPVRNYHSRLRNVAEARRSRNGRALE